MITFVLLALALIAGILLLVLLPLLRRQHTAAAGSPDTSLEHANIGIYRDQLHELDDDLAAGTIDGAQHAEARRELERRLLDDTARAGAAAAPPQAGKWTTAILATVIPLAAIGLYLMVGTPQVFTPPPPADVARNITPEQVEQMIEKLAARMKASPEDGEGWIMLGRSYAALERFDESAAAYAEAAARLPNDARLLVDYADVLGMSQGRRLSGEPEKLVKRALAIDPGHPKALALAGTIAFEQQKYAAAVTHWQKLVDSLPPDAEIVTAIKGSIAEAQVLAGNGAKSTTGKQENIQKKSPNPLSARVGGSIRIAGTLKAKAAPDDTVFIFARAVDGPPAPLAILRKRVADLPIKFMLDDTMAMAPGMNLSRFDNVIIGARISKSGTANRQAGNLEGFSKPVKVGVTDVTVVIDTEVRDTNVR